MRIVVLDGHAVNPGDLSWDGFEKLGALTVYDRSPKDDEAEIQRRIGDAEILAVNKTPVSASTMDACRNLKYIGVLATGCDVVDLDSARKRGITVTNVPAYGTAAVGQFAIALLLEICHHIGHHSNAVHEGRWSSSQDWCFWDHPLIELDGKTIGIIGFGRIGQTTGRIAKALGMRVLAFDANPSAEGADIAEYVSLDALLEKSDVVSLHCPLLPSTEGIIRKETISRMKDGVIVINNSRGQLVAEKDLAEALETGKVRAAGVDVASSEPIQPDNPLLGARNCFITPHISWASKESRARLMDMAVENLKAFISGNAVNVVNPRQ